MPPFIASRSRNAAERLRGAAVCIPAARQASRGYPCAGISIIDDAEHQLVPNCLRFTHRPRSIRHTPCATIPTQRVATTLHLRYSVLPISKFISSTQTGPNSIVQAVCWATAVLRRLMRHSSIATTMAYYVDLDSAEVADQLWADYGNTPAAGNTLGNTGPKEAENEASPTVASDYRAFA
jgi:hypothetical protein